MSLLFAKPKRLVLPGTLAQWPLNQDGSDISGSAYDLSNAGSGPSSFQNTLYPMPKGKYCTGIFGSTDYLQQTGGLLTGMDNLLSWSMSAWTYINDLSSDRLLVAWTNSGVDESFVKVTSTGSLNFTKGGLSLSSATGLITTGSWFHWAFTVESTNTRKLYINKVLVGQDANSGRTNNVINFRVGREVVASATLPLDGYMLDLRIFNRAISQGELG